MAQSAKRFKQLSLEEKYDLYRAIFYLSQRHFPPEYNLCDLASLNALMNNPPLFLGNQDNVEELQGSAIWKEVKAKLDDSIDDLSGEEIKPGVEFVFSFHTTALRESALASLANSAYPKYCLDRLRPSLNETVDRLNKFDRRMLRSVTGRLLHLQTFVEELQDDIGEFLLDLDKWDRLGFAESLEQLATMLRQRASCLEALPAVVSFLHNDFMIALFAYHAKDVLLDRAFDSAVRENNKDRCLRVHEAHYVIGRLEEKVLGSSLELSPIIGGSPAIKQQIRRWKRNYIGKQVSPAFSPNFV